MDQKTRVEIYPVILAGGSGTRLWPLSGATMPKQFLRLLGPRTLFQETLLRLEGLGGARPPIVVSGEHQKALASEQSAEIGKHPQLIVLEPEGRNTAPALTLAALRLQEVQPEDAVMLVMPSDHLIQGLKAFQIAAKKGAQLAKKGYLVTFGIRPTYAATGYGYIRKGEALDLRVKGKAFFISAFLEKPAYKKARRYVTSGDYLWNSGIFMMKASIWLSELEHHRADIWQTCRDAYRKATINGPFLRPDAETFKKCPRDSIDYAVMEKAPPTAQKGRAAGALCAVIPLDAGWTDLGDWASVWETGEKDAGGNVIKGEVRAESVANSLLIAQHRLLAAVGLEDVVVVETADGVLVARKDHSQAVKALAEKLVDKDRPPNRATEKRRQSRERRSRGSARQG